MLYHLWPGLWCVPTDATADAARKAHKGIPFALVQLPLDLLTDGSTDRRVQQQCHNTVRPGSRDLRQNRSRRNECWLSGDFLHQRV